MVRPFCFATVDSIPYDAALHRHKSSASQALKLGLGDVRTRGGAPRCMAGAWLEHGWSFWRFGAAVQSGAAIAGAQWQELSKRRGVSRLLIGRAKCRCAPQPGQSAARSRLPAGV
ncbi:hypothetical protein CFAM422_000787 [Trichoderma lentiforme]|uniref:Uncharacterized protein n=1 Tax=Trichoderma lentiforme TaxID=1567552 RepID=A0A9P5CJE1_9HYPO|nr:hypothetical protein CFAM422_000787 [Trichoderma lentiforme]